MEDPRTRRLWADYQRMSELQAQSDLISFEVYDAEEDSPPEKYLVTFKCRGIRGIDADRRPIFSKHHQVIIYLDRSYPFLLPPMMRWMTPIWHPNIQHKEPYGVCINQWIPSRTLDSLVLMLGEMLQYKNYHADKNTPPGVYDEEVAEWALWAESQGIVSPSKPVDERALLRPVPVKAEKPQKPAKPVTPVKPARHVKVLGTGKEQGKAKLKVTE